ncbi:MAG: 3-phosphoshikimate 1-carboxyvinyltransferase [Flavobacterium sp.]|nr:3-phosphoshikimate 1-carboxyvinyltransferase [Flavobacterium sp.]
MRVESGRVKFGHFLGTLHLSASKSEFNRALILQALYPTISISGHSIADDVQVMQKALAQSIGEIDCHHAGTALRFLTAYFASREGVSVIVKGSTRLHERPIAPLVQALQNLGASITYLEKEGFPPLQIEGKKLTKQSVAISSNQSSQFVTALLLIGASLPNGLELHLENEAVSAPYIAMTLDLLANVGVSTRRTEQLIYVHPLAEAKPVLLPIESDWSSASYYYAIVALSPVGTSIELHTFFAQSRQGDAQVAQLFAVFGVCTTFVGNQIIIKKERAVNFLTASELSFNLVDQPDLAQTLAVTCAGLGCKATITGLQTLKIKETDRLLALQTELTKLGVSVQISDNSLRLQAPDQLNQNVKIATYNDHRMALSFACLAVKTPIVIENPSVVVKSYPEFWMHLSELGFSCSQ